MGLSLAAAELIAPILGATAYGIHLVTFGIAMQRLLTTESGRLKHRAEVRWIMVVVACVLLINATLDLVVAIITLVQAFVLYTGPGGAEQIFLHGDSWQAMTKSFCVPFQSLVGDTILIYRCWFLWDRSWLVIALPLLIWLANTATFIRFLILLAQATQGLIISSAVQPWVRGFWAMTITINVMTTFMIVARIWMVDRQNKRLGIDADEPRSTLGYAMRNIVESGMIYTAVSLFMLIAVNLKSTLSYPASGLEIHSVGITFNLIIIRASRIARSPQNTTVSLRFTQARSATAGREGTEVFAHSHIDKESPFTTTQA
ncbi:hypothetical protein C8F04DRAFT_1237045 [Mycena alexandri]|uniref:Uncharacterized protein n=1 Tax=Mycena alexandri TaxID=1745969 RepID=A0AAD6SN24_9AGAR|nr:hypothetical protein C8F04DRAFT_1237045 [Mycena alexandri]